jgi:two-component system alkaline phosphatase synthesis response regulator PhoP
VTRILAVDDEPKILAVIQARLESVGYEVFTAEDGLTGLKQAHSLKPDLIILDLILPGLNGYQICSLLKRDKAFKSIPILMLTARSQAKDIQEGMLVGADAYMTKPYKAESLLEKIKELLDRRAAEPKVERKDVSGKLRMQEILREKGWTEEPPDHPKGDEPK